MTWGFVKRSAVDGHLFWTSGTPDPQVCQNRTTDQYHIYVTSVGGSRYVVRNQYNVDGRLKYEYEP